MVMSSADEPSGSKIADVEKISGTNDVEEVEKYEELEKEL